MKELFVIAAASAIAGCMSFKDSPDTLTGSWGARLPYDSMNAGHLIFSRAADGGMNAVVLWRWGSPCDCTNLKVSGNEFSFDHPYGVRYRGRIFGDRMFGEIAPLKDGNVCGDFQRFEGWRNPEVAPANTADAKLGDPIDLLKDGLDGWMAMEATGKFGWAVKEENGVKVLSNSLGLKPDGSWAGGGINLMTRRNDFYDFNLEYDVRVPKDSNSGVYLRGRYECQVRDSFGKPVDSHNMGAYYGRVCPSVAAEKKPGEWQHVSITLYKRHITIVLNGVKIIDNAPVVGITGGAIDAHEFVAGPIYLQGDHSDADYKNMILRPAL